MPAFVRRLAVRLKDAARYSPVVGAGRFAWLLAKTCLARTPAARLAPLFRAYRFTWRPFWLRYIGRRIDRLDPWPADAARAELFRNWPHAPNGSGELTRSLILKAPQPTGERGALLLTAEYNWLRLFADPAAAGYVAERYDLLVSAGWSPTDHLLVAHGLRAFPGRVFVEPANHSEAAKLAALGPRVTPLPTICCDWIHPDLVRPADRAERTTDILMVANWAPFKRHWHLFDALRRMDPGLKVIVIGTPDGPHTLARVKRQLADFGPPQAVEFLESVPIAEVRRRQATAKVFVILSRHEGCCVSVAEAMFADTPVGLLHDAHIGPRAYINPQTGVLLPHRRLADALTRFLTAADGFRPRAWAEQHISCHKSLAKVNGVVREAAAKDGRPWTHDLAPFCWHPYACLLSRDAAARLAPALADLRGRFPHLFGPAMLSRLPGQ